MASLNFNAETVQPDAGFDPVPAGDYPVVVTDSEMKPTKAGTGHYLQLTLQVIDGQAKGRLIWYRLNIQNPNATAQEIGLRQLSALCHAVGKLQVQDSTELHGIPFVARVIVREDPNYGPSNEVKSVKGFNQQPAPQPTQQPAPQPAATTTPPWQQPAA